MTDAGDVFAEFIESELDHERRRRAAIDGRGVALVTTSGSFSSLILAGAAIVTGSSSFEAAPALLLALVAAIVLFASTGIAGILASRPHWYTVTDTSTLAAMIAEHWDDERVDALQAVSQLNTQTLESLRQGNAKKASIAVSGTWLQVAAGAVLAFGLAAQIIA
jgi:hypothetical protein